MPPGNTANNKQPRAQQEEEEQEPPSRGPLLLMVLAVFLLCSGAAVLGLAYHLRDAAAVAAQETAALEAARMQAELVQKELREEVVGGERFHPSFGVFPAGCKWRVVESDGADADGASTTRYQWWDEARGAWHDQRPAACSPTGPLVPPGLASVRRSTWVSAHRQRQQPCAQPAHSARARGTAPMAAQLRASNLPAHHDTQPGKPQQPKRAARAHARAPRQPPTPPPRPRPCPPVPARAQKTCDKAHCVYTNMYYNDGNWYVTMVFRGVPWCSLHCRCHVKNQAALTALYTRACAL